MKEIFLIIVAPDALNYTFLYAFFAGIVLFAIIALMLPDRERDERNKKRESSLRESSFWLNYDPWEFFH